MSDVKKKYEALRDENERLARLAERQMSNPDLTPDERDAARDRAKVHWQLSREAADTVAYAVQAKLERFDAPNKGLQDKTKGKIDFLKSVAVKIGTTKRNVLAYNAATEPGVEEFFTDQEAIYRFLEPKIRRQIDLD